MNKSTTIYDTIIIGGSYAGLSAALALGRSLRKTLVLDNGQPCNAPTPHSHNFLTQDGHTPGQISKTAREQVQLYPSVSFAYELAITGIKQNEIFAIGTDKGSQYRGRKLIFATGLQDLMPDIPGFEACWGKSVIHCPYCHGYEVKGKKTAIIADEAKAMHYAWLIRNWTSDLTLLTHGKSKLNEKEKQQLANNKITLIETPIKELIHKEGYLEEVIFSDDTSHSFNALYSAPDYTQKCNIPEQLGCTLTDEGLLTVDATLQTNVPGVFACGDCAHRRAVSIAVSTGSMAGIMANHQLLDDEFLE